MVVTLPAGTETTWLGTFGERWVQTICTVAGCATSHAYPDVFGTDLMVLNNDGDIIRVQVKTTEASVYQSGDVHYPLDVDSYNRLREGSTLGYLIVVSVHVPHPGWTRHFRRGSSVRATARWRSLSPLQDTDNVTTVTVILPAGNILTPASLLELFEES